MGLRNTDAEVKQILDTTIDTTPFIRVANQVVESQLVGKGLGNVLLKEIERWLSAHFASSSDKHRQPKMIKVGATQVDYGSRMDIKGGFDTTSYGQNAVLLDTTGTLANLGKRKARMDTIQALSDVRDT